MSIVANLAESSYEPAAEALTQLSQAVHVCDAPETHANHGGVGLGPLSRADT